MIQRQSNSRGMTLAEVMAALLLASMVLAAVLGLYGRMTHAATTVLERLDHLQEPMELAQLLANDLDRIVAAGTDTQIKLYPPQYDQGYNVTRLEIRRTYLDVAGQEQVLEEIIWQTRTDNATQRLTLYRAHNGEIKEDRFFDGKRRDIEAVYPFVPVYTGLSHFSLEAVLGEQRQDNWLKETLPPGLCVRLSFAEPTLSPGGEFTVPEEDVIERTIAIDRLRAIRFELPQNDGGGDPNQVTDPNNSLPTETEPRPIPPTTPESRPNAVQRPPSRR